MVNKIPKTKDEFFAILDAMLTDEDKKKLVESDDVFEFHFTLDLWIRNNWIYPLNEEEKQAFLSLFSNDAGGQYGCMPFHPDDISSEILEQYVEYLKKREETK